MMMTWLGIDFGSKVAGTTCIAWAENRVLQVTQSSKGKDADEWLLHHVNTVLPTNVFIDAPLSLPPAFADPASDDFFYRPADRELLAMSPMFLGGLTARAMRLKRTWERQGLSVHETYPAALVRQLQFEYYKEDVDQFLAALEELINKQGFRLKAKPANWHQMDALLAWWSGWRFIHHEARIVGDHSGTIIV